MAKKNKRGKPRVNLRISVSVKDKSRLQEFFSRNVSTGGIFLEIPMGKKAPEAGSILTLKFDVPGLKKKIVVEGEVVHKHEFEAMDEDLFPSKHHGVGIRFINIGDPDRKLIEEYVKGKALNVNA